MWKILVLLALSVNGWGQVEHPILKLGSPAPDFELPWSRASRRGSGAHRSPCDRPRARDPASSTWRCGSPRSENCDDDAPTPGTRRALRPGKGVNRVRPFEVGDDEAPEGREGQGARETVRQAHPSGRGRRPRGRGRPRPPTPACGRCTRRPVMRRCRPTRSTGRSSGGPASSKECATSRSPTRGTRPRASR